MMCNKLVCAALAASFCAAPASAGLVWFSRANCLNNESISWDWPGRAHLLSTSSHHRHAWWGWEKPVRTGWQWTDRSAAVHWGEGLAGGFYVQGRHYESMQPYGEYFLGYSQATDCNFADGQIPVLAGASPNRVRQFIDDLATVRKAGAALPAVPAVAGRLEALRLGFSPAVVPRGTLIGAAPQGTLVDGAWSGVERYFRLERAGYFRVSETNMAASGGSFHMTRAAVNAAVGGRPAISAVFADEKGMRIDEVLWIDGARLTMVTFMGSHASALALARELRPPAARPRAPVRGSRRSARP